MNHAPITPLSPSCLLLLRSPASVHISTFLHDRLHDGENTIAKVDAGTGNEASYFYDATNWRVKRLAGGFTTYYVWEGAQVIAEYSNAPAGAGGTNYYLADRLSNRAITDSSGLVKGTQDHLPFGEEGGTSGTSEKHRFTNYERDAESNTDYAINRQYGTGVARFMQSDPIQGSIAAPQSLNRYAYVGNDPVNLLDPLGLFCVVKYKYEYSNDGDTINIKVITVNSNGFYFSGRIASGQAVNTVRGGGFEGLNLTQIRGAVLIHELLHAIGAIPSDDPKAPKDGGAQSRANAELVRKNCF